MITVLIADDHPPLREGIKQRLERQDDIRVVGEAGTGPELFVLLNDASRSPDVLLLDIRMPEFDILKAIPKIRTRHPKTGILIVSAYDDHTHVNQLLDADVDGYLIKSEDMSTYVRAIRDVAAGRTHFSQRVFGLARATADLTRLSVREMEVLTFVARDATTQEIGASLGISPRTVETHIKRACQKLGVNSRAAAAAKAVQLGYISAID